MNMRTLFYVNAVVATIDFAMMAGYLKTGGPWGFFLILGLIATWAAWSMWRQGPEED